MPGTIDTLSIYQRLKSANLEDEAAKEIAEVIKDVTESHLVSTSYLDKALEKTKVELQNNLGSLDKALEKTKVELQNNIGTLDRALEKTKLELQKEIELSKTCLQKEIEILRVEMYKTKAEILKWVAGMLVAQAAIVATIVKLL